MRKAASQEDGPVISKRNALCDYFTEGCNFIKGALKLLIDFHTHAFPDKIAERAILSLAAKAKIPYFTIGTLDDTDEKMKEWGVDKRVMLSIATNPRQQENVNNFAIEANKRDNIIAFGSVHPEAENALEELERIAAAGLKGIKLHPEYQEFNIADKAMFAIYARCIELGLIVTFHTGKDLGYPGSLRASPDGILRLADRFPDGKFVLAHFGSSMLEDEVLEKLAGKIPYYMDTAFCVGYTKPDVALKIIKTHGADKILFASDCPWSSSKETYDYINTLDLTADEKDKIFCKNALNLLGL